MNRILLLAALGQMVGKGEILTLDQALANSDDHQPLLAEARASALAAKARVDETRGPLLPQINGTAALYYSDYFGNYTGASTTTVTGAGGGPGGSTSGLGGSTGTSAGGAGASVGTSVVGSGGRTILSLTASQLIYDFGATWDRFRSAEVGETQYQFSADEQRVQSRLTTRDAFFNARAQKALLRVATETLSNEQKHLVQTEAGVRVGTQAEIALAQERATLASDQFQVIQAQGTYATGKSQLNQAMGLEGPIDYEVQEIDAPAVLGEDSSTDELMDQALKVRPAFEAIQHQVDAQSFLVAAYRGSYWPSLSAIGGVQATATRPSAIQGDVFGELALNWVLFNGLTNVGNVNEQKANLLNLEAQRDALRQQIRVDVETSRVQVISARSGIDSAQSAVINARELLRLAEARYQTGVGSVIELGDAQVAYTNAQVQLIQANYTLNVARSTLLAKLGQP